MPFTLSHAAAVLPAVRGDGTGRARLVPAVLVAGSFAPDLTYYAAGLVPGAMEFGGVTHSFPGVFGVDVLFAWVLTGWWLFVREPLVALLPRVRQGRVAALLRCGAPPVRVRASTVARWYVSAVLGALTHVVWDAFTHVGRWGVRLFPVLDQPVAGVPLYSQLQYGTSLLGAAVVAVFAAHALRRAPAVAPAGEAAVTEAAVAAAGEAAVTEAAVAAVAVLSARDRWRAAGALGGCTLLGAAARVARWAAGRGPGADPFDLIPAVCFGAGAGLLAGLLGWAAAVRARRPVPVHGGPEEGPGEAVGKVGEPSASRPGGR
ncbi:DUF4184 family protein [Streptomyces echinoruber]|uniref:DUF4184 family protein n=1 Tax=Streptomyces echinoruber TaxID=68898 RepID=A0A918V4V9_9ACTN|nr:DUF4184 family protein [Streptomyces echinoruber]GGZ68870.1 hypothetical protein GCM10010389_02650 [Streptomyces echinoruber]